LLHEETLTVIILTEAYLMKKYYKIVYFISNSTIVLKVSKNYLTGRLRSHNLRLKGCQHHRHFTVL